MMPRTPHRRESLAPLCPHCGEPVDTWPDPGGGPVQTYIEDCSVCCRPLRIVARFGDSHDDFSVEVSDES